MAVQTGPLQLRRLTTAQLSAVTPAVGEPVYDKTLKKLVIGDGVTPGGVVPSNAFTADKLTTARNIVLTGTVTGTVSFDGSANVSMSTSVGTSLQTSLDLKAPLASPALTGVPTVPTAAVDTNTTQAASTAFVVGQAGATTPIVNGTGAAGTSLRYSRQDHVHPTDTSRAPLASPGFTGVPTAPTASIGTNTTQLATMAALQARILGTVSQSAGVPTGTIIERGSNANGEYVKFADGTMICTLVVASQSVAVTTAYGSLFIGNPPAWTFPVAFVGTFPIVDMTPFVSGKLAWSTRSATASLTTATMAIIDITSATSNFQLTYKAIGRWF